jgi:two-component system response regulator MprA
MRVLLIEDDGPLAESLAEALRDEGNAVQIAADGAIGWKALQDGPPPDAVILDLMMPNMDGHAFRRKQMGDGHLASIPTLVITGQPVEPEAMVSLGAAVMRKPFALASFLAALTELSNPARGRTKTCACGRAYTAEEWRTLDWVGLVDNGREAGEELELRNCVGCGSTIAWPRGLHAISVKVRRSEPPQAG